MATTVITYYRNLSSEDNLTEIFSVPKDYHTIYEIDYFNWDIGNRNFLEWNTAQDGTGTSYSPGDKIYLALDLYAIYETIETYYTVKQSSLTAVADAIREKSGGSQSLSFPNGFVSEIGNISSGGGGGSQYSIVIKYKGDASAFSTATADYEIEVGSIASLFLDVEAKKNVTGCLYGRNYSYDDEEDASSVYYQQLRLESIGYGFEGTSWPGYGFMSIWFANSERRIAVRADDEDTILGITVM